MNIRDTVLYIMFTLYIININIRFLKNVLDNIYRSTSYWDVEFIPCAFLCMMSCFWEIYEVQFYW
jgi:hypothetical protein